MSKVQSWSRVAPNLYKGRLDGLPPTKRTFTYKGKKLPIDPNLLLNLAKGQSVTEGTSVIAIEEGIPYAYIYSAYTEPIDLTAWSVAEDASAIGNINWTTSDGWANGAPFNVGWKAQNVDLTNGILSLTLNNTPSSGYPYSSGEYRSTAFYKYGRYEASMKAAKGAGLMTGFFSYTGSSDGNPHDEIDIEIAGDEPSTLRTNYWVSGVSHETFIALDFDASLDFHTYAFEWLPNSIEWFVDGKSVRFQQGGTLPTTPQRIMANLWAGDSSTIPWLGAFSYIKPIAAQFKAINLFQFNGLVDEENNPIVDELGNPLIEG